MARPCRCPRPCLIGRASLRRRPCCRLPRSPAWTSRTTATTTNCRSPATAACVWWSLARRWSAPIASRCSTKMARPRSPSRCCPMSREPRVAPSPVPRRFRRAWRSTPIRRPLSKCASRCSNRCSSTTRSTAPFAIRPASASFRNTRSSTARPAANSSRPRSTSPRRSIWVRASFSMTSVASCAPGAFASPATSPATTLWVS